MANPSFKTVSSLSATVVFVGFLFLQADAAEYNKMTVADAAEYNKMPVCGAMPFRNSFRVPEQTPSKQNSFRVPEQNLLTISNEVGKFALARTDWKESSTAIVISLDVPGLKKDDVKIEVEDNRVLTISGERKVDEEEAEGVKWLRAEWTTGKFRRQLSLPANADLDRIKAYLQDGVLGITVPKYSSQAKVIRIVDGCSCGQDIKATKSET